MIIFRWLLTNANIERFQQTNTSLHFFQTAELSIALHLLAVSVRWTLHTLPPHVHIEALQSCTGQHNQTGPHLSVRNPPLDGIFLQTHFSGKERC